MFIVIDDSRWVSCDTQRTSSAFPNSELAEEYTAFDIISTEPGKPYLPKVWKQFLCCLIVCALYCSFKDEEIGSISRDSDVDFSFHSNYIQSITKILLWASIFWYMLKTGNPSENTLTPRFVFHLINAILVFVTNIDNYVNILKRVCLLNASVMTGKLPTYP